ncbi:MAG: hypothetical protein Tsb0010_04330 [Parvularculaceae bacterium]
MSAQLEKTPAVAVDTSKRYGASNSEVFLELCELAALLMDFEVDARSEEALAVACALRNCARAETPRRAVAPPSGPAARAFAGARASDAALSDAEIRRWSAKFESQRFRRAFSLALEGIESKADPTGGATRFHPHDAPEPRWTEFVEATALIGDWMFYRPAKPRRHGAADCVDPQFAAIRPSDAA